MLLSATVFPIVNQNDDATAATGTALPSTTTLTLSSTNDNAYRLAFVSGATSYVNHAVEKQYGFAVRCVIK